MKWKTEEKGGGRMSKRRREKKGDGRGEEMKEGGGSFPQSLISRYKTLRSTVSVFGH